jgi:hypothetical protein
MVGHLIEADADDAEIIHACPLDNGEPSERRLALAAHEAGRAMLTQRGQQWTDAQSMIMTKDRGRSSEVRSGRLVSASPRIYMRSACSSF